MGSDHSPLWWHINVVAHPKMRSAKSLTVQSPIELSSTQMQAWMERLIERARRFGERGEVPVSAIVLDHQGRCIGHGINQRELNNDPLGHAELMAVRQACRLRGDWRLNDCTLLVTLEPCPMCAGALVQARVGKVIFAASDPKRGAMGSTVNLATHVSAHHRMTVIGGVQAEEAKEMLSNWFRQRRRRSDGIGEAPFQTDSTTC
jgi:tRNA(adenine34) deaminase